MKNKILFLLAVISICYESSSQRPIVKDTIGYLKKMEALKADYVGQPFSKLLNDLKMNIVYFCPMATDLRDIAKEPQTVFRFARPNLISISSSPSMVIFWQSYVNSDQSLEIADSGIFGKWTDVAKTHYQNAIVRDISIMGDGTDRLPPPGGWANWKDQKRHNKRKKTH